MFIVLSFNFIVEQLLLFLLMAKDDRSKKIESTHELLSSISTNLA